MITIMVLDLKPPAQAKLSAQLPLWPTALSYGVSNLFVAIIWINHHLSTAWIADTRLAAGPVLLYAAVFVMVNIAFLGYQQEALSQESASEVSLTTRRFTRVRALITQGIFVSAACICGIGSWSGQLSQGAGGHPRGDRRQRGLMLPIL
jgi:uncharacterized membrane protein